MQPTGSPVWITRLNRVQERLIGENLRTGSSLLEAAYRGDIDSCRVLINDGCDVNASNRDGATALFLAIQQNHCEIAKLLLRAGSAVETPKLGSIYKFCADQWSVETRQMLLAWKLRHAPAGEVLGMIVGDSTVVPRNFGPDFLRSEETWPMLLSQKVQHWRWLVSGLGSRSVRELPECFERQVYYYRPDFVIVVVGVVDCSFRVLTRAEKRLLQRLPQAIRTKIHAWLKRNHLLLSKLRKSRYTPERQFRKFLEATKSIVHSLGCTLFYCPILPPGAHFIAQAYDIEASVGQYNHLLRECFGREWEIPVSAGPEFDTNTALIGDGVHLSRLGHKIVASQIGEFFRRRGFIAD